MARKPKQWIKTTIAEPFPVFYGHVSQKNRRCGEAEGPFYSAGRTFYALPSEQHWAFEQWRAAGLRAEGYTVTVEMVTR